MANCVLECGVRAVRLNYHDLEKVLLFLVYHTNPNSPAHRIMDPWLGHILERLGYVLLREDVLEDLEALRAFRDILTPHKAALEAGEPLLPSGTIELVRGTQHYQSRIRRAALVSTRLLTFLNEVISDKVVLRNVLENGGRVWPPSD